MSKKGSTTSTKRKTAALSRFGRRAGLGVLLVGALCAGVLGFGHHHAGDELVDEHQCSLCQVQQSTIEPAPAVSVVSAVPLCGRTFQPRTEHLECLASRLSPPLRGPPLS